MKPTASFRRIDAPSHPLPTGLVVTPPGRVFVFNQAGRLVWDALAQPHALPALFSQLASEHDLTEDRFQREVVSFVAHLHTVGLIEVVNG